MEKKIELYRKDKIEREMVLDPTLDSLDSVGLTWTFLGGAAATTFGAGEITDRGPRRQELYQGK